MENKWWKNRVFYQIYPRSFCDSNGDGIGDIPGIISKLDYLKWLGVGAVWLNPIYDSPNNDMGYDIRDYRRILSDYGNMEDFDKLLNEMHNRDIKLIMDLVVNHTSDENKFFIESRSSKNNKYRDYYIWKTGKNGKEPNNWASFFTPSTWKYDNNTKEWYLHLFSEKQPDLNWENPNVRNDIYSMINYWLDKGIDGFRMDVINLIAKHTDFPDAQGIPNNSGYVFPEKYIAMQPKLHNYLSEMRTRCFDNRDCMCVGETPFVTTENAGSLVNNSKELDMIFQFDIMDIDSKENKWNTIPFEIKKLKNIINTWQNTLEWNTLFWGNHDQSRMVSRFGNTTSNELRERSAKMLATIMYLLKGTPFIYQGDEIGMTNMDFKCKDNLRDIESIQYLENNEDKEQAWNNILLKGRDNARTPLQWSGKKNAGFTEGTPWIMVNPNYKKINVEKEIDDNNSILNFYRLLINFRNTHEAIISGKFSMQQIEDEQIIAYTRYNNNEKYLIIANFSNSEAYLKFELGNNIELCNVTKINKKIMLPYEVRVIRI